MGFIPKDAMWYVADIVEEVRVQGDHRNVVHINQILIRADSPADAHQKAIVLGKSGNLSYRNPEGKRVTIRFRGLRDLNVIHDELQHGAEISYWGEIGVPEKRIRSWILPKRKLGVFAPIRQTEKPSYASADVMEEVYKRWPGLRGTPGPASKKSRRLKASS